MTLNGAIEELENLLGFALKVESKTAALRNQLVPPMPQAPPGPPGEASQKPSLPTERIIQIRIALEYCLNRMESNLDVTSNHL